jgi:protein O-GlcNAc transferase
MSAPGRNDPCPCGSGKKYKQCCLKRDEVRASEQRAGSAQVAQMLQAALAHHRAGRLIEAEDICRQILQSEPDHPDALHLLGVVAYQKGQNEAAAELIGKSVGIKPSVVAYCNLGNALLGQGRPEDAAVSYQRAIALQPDYAEAHFNLGLAFQNQDRLDEAVASYQRAIAIKPDYAEAHNNMGIALQRQGKLRAAAESYRQSLALRPDNAEAHNNLGYALRELGELAEAITHCRMALALKPDFVEGYYNLGIALQTQKQFDEAIANYRLAIELRPEYADAHVNLGTALQELGMQDEAYRHLSTAILLKPDNAEAYIGLGNIQKDQGRLDEAIANCRKALALRPDHIAAHSNLLFFINYHPKLSAEEVFAEYRCWNGAHAKGLFLPHTFDNDRTSLRRLRIGYVSPDLCKHSVHFFVEPLLAAHDKSAVEVYAYSNVATEDDVSVRLKSYTDHWLNTVGLADEELAAHIRADGIDILVDLAGHTAGNRLLVFARKPAPIQVSWLGYGYTTGLDTMDYLFADPYFAPTGCESLFSEHIFRLPVFTAYRAAEGMGETGDLPAIRNGHVTFGTLSRSIRINDHVVDRWSEILRRVPTSLLLINNSNFKQGGGMEEQFRARFAKRGIAAERLILGYDTPPWDVMRNVDITLDCFPHNSGTTLIESLYMGVPFVSLAGRPSVGRLGDAVAHAIGHPEWVAQTEDEYIEKALGLASDITHLERLRSSLRQDMLASPLMDGASFARSVEGAYRTMWEKWCTKEA